MTDSKGDIPRAAGQSLVELALILPVFLIIVLGSIDIGRGFIFGVAVQDGARESTRVAANARVDPGVTDAFIVQRVIYEDSLLNRWRRADVLRQLPAR